MALHRFDSLAAFARAARKMPDRYLTSATSWTGNESTDDAIRFATEGNTATVPLADALLSQIQASIDTPMPQWVPSVAGAYPMVPEAIAGFPQCMRTRATMNEDRAPIRVYVCTTSSSTVRAATLRKRGCAILALAMALGSIRPFELYIVSTLDGNTNGESITAVRINTTPLDIASAAYALTSTGLDRALFHSFSRWKDHYRGRWPESYSYGNPWPYLNDLRRRLGGSPNDLIIKPTEANDKMVTDPVTWVNAQIARFTECQDQDEAA